MTEHVFYHEHTFGVKPGRLDTLPPVAIGDWLKKLLGRSDSVSPADEARAEHQIDSDAVDRYAGRVMGVYGDIGPTVPSPQSPPDRPPTD